MCYEPDGYYEFYDEAIRKARSEHRCDSCRKSIYPGQLYMASAFKFDGVFTSYKTCGSCMAAVYTLHIVELHEGCPSHTSWYPPEECRDELRRMLADVKYYSEEHPEQCGEYGAGLIGMAPMFEFPSVEHGQRYLKRKKLTGSSMILRYAERLSQP